MGDGVPLQMACFLMGVAATAKWVRDLEYERFLFARRQRRSSAVAAGQSGKIMLS